MKKLNEILLIDDDTTALYVSKRVIEKIGIAKDIITVKNGEEALKEIQQRCDDQSICPEFIILDTHMPVMDGIEFLQALHGKNFSNWQRVVILVLTAHISPNDIQLYKDLGVTEFSDKPLSKQTVMAVYDKYWNNIKEGQINK